MPSFDISCTLDRHELANAVDQANREMTNRFDFKGITAGFELQADRVLLAAESEFQLVQMRDILKQKVAKRGVDLGHIAEEPPCLQGQKAEQSLLLREGISSEIAKKIVQFIKKQKTKAQASIQGDQVRVQSKKIDELQEIIQQLKEADFELPLQFDNFRQ